MRSISKLKQKPKALNYSLKNSISSVSEKKKKKKKRGHGSDQKDTATVAFTFRKTR